MAHRAYSDFAHLRDNQLLNFVLSLGNDGGSGEESAAAKARNKKKEDDEGFGKKRRCPPFTDALVPYHLSVSEAEDTTRVQAHRHFCDRQCAYVVNDSIDRKELTIAKQSGGRHPYQVPDSSSGKFASDGSEVDYLSEAASMSSVPGELHSWLPSG